MSISRSSGDDRVAPRPRPTFGVRLGTWLTDSGRLTQVVSVLGGLLVWELIASQFSHFILPPPSAVLARLLDPVFDLKLLSALGRSLQAGILGFMLSLAAAIPLGLLMGRNPRLNAMLDPIISALYSIPSVALVPFLVIWFGLFFESRLALIFIMAFPDILVVVVAGARDIRPNLINVGRSFGADRRQLAFKVIVPAMMPFLMTALRVGSARAINGMITAELFFAAVNLGEMMRMGTRSFDTAGVLTVVVVVCLLGLLAQSLIAALEARFLHWHLRR